MRFFDTNDILIPCKEAHTLVGVAAKGYSECKVQNYLLYCT